MRRAAIFALVAFAFTASLSIASGEKGKAGNSQRKVPVVDINRAGAAELEKLPGIGPELASRIVAYRRKHGPYRRIEDLMVIRGMGAKKWRAIRPYLAVDDDGRKAKKAAKHPTEP